jgi:hypothetical protein
MSCESLLSFVPKGYHVVNLGAFATYAVMINDRQEIASAASRNPQAWGLKRDSFLYRLRRHFM